MRYLLRCFQCITANKSISTDKMFLFKKKPHYGKRRHKIDFYLTVKNLCFTSNEYFIRNSFYTLYIENDKANKIRSKDNLYSFAEIRCVNIDEVLKFTSTLYIDYDVLSTSKG